MRKVLCVLIPFLFISVHHCLNECGNGINLCDITMKMIPTKCFENKCEGETSQYTLRCCSNLNKAACLRACNLTDFAVREPCSPRCVNGKRGADGICHCNSGFTGNCCDDCPGGKSFCSDKGYCGLVGKERKCYCKDGFYGDKCQHVAQKTTTKSNNNSSSQTYYLTEKSKTTNMYTKATSRITKFTIEPKANRITFITGPTTTTTTSKTEVKTTKTTSTTKSKRTTIGTSTKSTTTITTSPTDKTISTTSTTKLTAASTTSVPEPTTAITSTTSKTTYTTRPTFPNIATTAQFISPILTTKSTTGNAAFKTEFSSMSSSRERLPKIVTKSFETSTGLGRESTTVKEDAYLTISSNLVKIFAVVFFPIASVVVLFSCCFYLVKFWNKDDDVNKVIPLTINRKSITFHQNYVGETNKRRRDQLRPQIRKL